MSKIKINLQIIIDPISLPNNSVILKAWSYDPAAKEAIQLSQEHKLTWK